MNFIGIIPARFASTRFPGKPLVEIGGKTMIERVYIQASKALQTVYVATDDDRIKQKVLSFGGKVVMTSEKHKSGTDRCGEAIKFIHDKENCLYDVVLNIQGDEPFIQPDALLKLMSCFTDTYVQIATLLKEIKNHDELFNPNVVKAVKNKKNEAIYFSRSTIPFLRNFNKEEWFGKYPFFKHVGIYAYKTEILFQLVNLETSPLELAESLEQNRWIENGFKIKTEVTDYESLAVDTKEDLENILKQGLP